VPCDRRLQAPRGAGQKRRAARSKRHSCRDPSCACKGTYGSKRGHPNGHETRSPRVQFSSDKSGGEGGRRDNTVAAHSSRSRGGRALAASSVSRVEPPVRSRRGVPCSATVPVVVLPAPDSDGENGAPLTFAVDTPRCEGPARARPPLERGEVSGDSIVAAPALTGHGFVGRNGRGRSCFVAVRMTRFTSVRSLARTRRISTGMSFRSSGPTLLSGAAGRLQTPIEARLPSGTSRGNGPDRWWHLRCKPGATRAEAMARRQLVAGPATPGES